MAGQAHADWEDDEIEATVTAYFRLLDGDAIHGKQPRRPVLEELHRKFPERTIKAFEYKFQNVSAVLEELGELRLEGFAPARNAQQRLRKAVAETVEHRNRRQGMLA